MAGKKPQIPPDTVAALRAVSLWDYIEHYDRAAWRKIGRHYFNVEHDSLCVSENGKWHWQSRGEGGTTALDYLMMVKGLSFYDALLTLQKAQLIPAITLEHHPETPATGLMLPPAHSNNHVVIRYLADRGISEDIIHTCIAAGYLYQSQEQGGGMAFHNAIFVGYDSRGIPRNAFKRGTSSVRYAADVAGSDKAYSFSLPAVDPNAHTLLRTEGAIDALSLVTLAYERSPETWRNTHYLAGGLTHLPLDRYLAEHPQITTIMFCYDRDAAGLRMTRKHMSLYQNRGYTVTDHTAPLGDWNEYLLHMKSRKEDCLAHHPRDPVR